MKENDYYKPSDDTFLLAECVKNLSGDNALEIAAGTGYISDLLRKKFNVVVATDLNFNALKEANKSISLVCCDSISAIKNIMFDLIVINPPYLPSKKIDDLSVDGGKDGIEVTLKMLEDARELIKDNGTIFVVTSSLAKYDGLLKHMRKLGYRTEVIARKKLDFEELLVISAKI